MKSRSILSHLLAAAAGITLVTCLAAGRSAPAPAQPGDLDPKDPKALQAAMEHWMKSIQPGKQHKFLEQFVGQWETKTKMFMDPGAAPIETTGSTVTKMIHGGRFLHQEYTGTMKIPGPDGQMHDTHWTGLGLTGFDNNRKLFTFTWSDNMTTGIMTGKGALSQDGKTLTCFGEMDEPMTGEMGKTIRYTTKVVSADKWTFQIDEVIYGDPFKVVEVEYTRMK